MRVQSDKAKEKEKEKEKKKKKKESDDDEPWQAKLAGQVAGKLNVVAKLVAVATNEWVARAEETVDEQSNVWRWRTAGEDAGIGLEYAGMHKARQQNEGYQGAVRATEREQGGDDAQARAQGQA